ncbi:MAG: hypothetical protein ACLTYN_03765 [Dysosmobacter welbionis]
MGVAGPLVSFGCISWEKLGCPAAGCSWRLPTSSAVSQVSNWRDLYSPVGGVAAGAVKFLVCSLPQLPLRGGDLAVLVVMG